MKKITTLVLGILASVFFLTGCASVVSKSEWPVSFKSDPPGAEVVIKDISGNEINNGITPATFTLRSSSGFFSGANYYAEFKLNDYKVVKTRINSTVNGWYWGNILLCQFGLIGGLIVDPVTGAMYKLPPECVVNLNKVESPNGKQ